MERKNTVKKEIAKDIFLYKEHVFLSKAPDGAELKYIFSVNFNKSLKFIIGLKLSSQRD
jgi:hypothetical protein